MLKVVLAALCLTAIQAAILHHDSVDRIPGQYIVVLKPVEGARSAKLRYLANAINKVRSLSGEINTQWDIGSFLGFRLNTDNEAVAEAVSNLPEVKFVEADAMAYAYQSCQTDNSAIWSLARVSGRASAAAGYSWDAAASASVAVYVLDTGIRITHNDFGSRASHGANFVSGEGPEDNNGHGTHCAGTAVGTQFGVAKTVDTVNVKVLSQFGSGAFSQIIDGVNWSVADGAYSQRVLSMSLGGGSNAALNAAVDAATAAGCLVVVAAGNSNANACNFSPAGASTAFTVGSTQQAGDSRSSFSNWGTCVDNFAPGSSITSAWHTSDTATNTISGTSMACPAVAGLAARYIAEFNSNATPAEIRAWIIDNGTTGIVGNPGTGSPNNFMHAACPYLP